MNSKWKTFKKSIVVKPLLIHWFIIIKICLRYMREWSSQPPNLFLWRKLFLLKQSFGKLCLKENLSRKRKMLIWSFDYLQNIGSISLLSLGVVLPEVVLEVIEDKPIDLEVINFHSFVMFFWCEKLQRSVCVEVVGDSGSAYHVVVSLFIDAEDCGGGIAVVNDQMEDIFGCEGRYFCFQV